MDGTNQLLEKENATPSGGLLKRFRKNQGGSVAIEFALLALPFSVLLFAIIETGMSFGAQQVMANAVDTVARQIRVNTIKTIDTAELKTKICGQMSFFVASGCPNLVVDLNAYTDYSTVPKTIPRTAGGDIDESGFQATIGTPDDIHHLRIFYRWPYYTDLIGHKLAELPDNKTLLYASTTWQNERP